MTDEQKGALAGGADGSGSTPTGTATPANTDAAKAEAAAGAETADQKAARLEKELAAEREQSTNTKKLLLSQKDKIEEANRVLASQRTPSAQSPAGDGASEVEGMMADLGADVQGLDREIQGETDPARKSLLKVERARSIAALATLDEKYRQEMGRRVEKQAEDVFGAEDKSVADHARRLYRAGGMSAPSAVAVAREASEAEKRFAAEKERGEQLQKDLNARKEGRVVVSGSPIIAVEKPSAGDKVKITRAQRAQIAAKPYNDPERMRYNAAYAQGNVEITD